MVMRRLTRGGAVLVAWLVSASVVGAQQRLNFVSCPIVRDTASVPCWLAEYEGEMYFLTLQTDVSAPVTPPWLGHRVLVEGTVSSEPSICGGKVLTPVRLSVLERDASCTTMLPAEERYNLTFEPPRPPGPSRGRLAFDAAPAPAPAGAVKSAPTTPTREFVVSYPFDGLVGFNHAGALTAILEFARGANAREIDIVGHRGAVRLSNGQTIVEDPAIARKRAEQVAALLQGAGLSGSSFKVSWRDEAAAATGTDDYASRRTVVTVRTR
jgi:outer membrane protein OmpA-like peptidoglycan-associated protein